MNRGIRLCGALLELVRGEVSPLAEACAEDRGCEIQSSDGRDSGDPSSIIPRLLLDQVCLVVCCYRMAATFPEGSRDPVSMLLLNV